VHETLKACELYYKRVEEELSDQNGVLPKMFVSAPLRDLFQGLVEQKAKLWTNLGDSWLDILKFQVRKEWFVHHAWQQTTTRTFSPESPDSGTVDPDCHDLVKSLMHWTETILGGRMNDIHRKRQEQTEHVLDFLQEIVEPLATEYSSIQNHFTPEKNKYFASLRSNIVLSQGVRHRMRLIDMNEIESMATGVIIMWRQIRIQQSKTINLSGIPPLPVVLTEWMRSEQSLDFPLTLTSCSYSSTGTLDQAHHFCRANGGGKRRVMCVLAGLVYKWLEERCMEWNAELAEHELLNLDFDDTAETSASSFQVLGGNSNANTNKSSKRNKKRKDKKKSAASSTADATSSTEEMAEPLLENTASNGIADMQPDDRESCSNENDENSAVADATEVEPLPEEMEEDAVKTFSEQIEDDSDNGIFFGDLSKVGVMDSTEFQSAGDFLLGRLLELVNAEQNGKRNNNVVFL
jgi:hypothetical protein